jgi:hypothetical protein
MLQPVPQDLQSPENGLSIVCGVKNRTDPLRYTIPTFLSQPMVRQIVLVDWDSDVPLIESLAELDIPGWPDQRVVIVRAENQPYWSMSRAINLGMKLVNQPVTLKPDADVVILEDVSHIIPKPGQGFVSGNWRTEKGNNVYLFGTTIFGTSDFWKIGGYDERIDTYGWEDDDFYERLSLSGLEHRDLPPRSFFHLPHSDAKRMAHQKSGLLNPKESIAINNKLVSNRKNWDRHSNQASFELVFLDEIDRYFVVAENRTIREEE